MPHTFLPSLLKEMTVYSYSFFSFTTLNKDNTISLIPKEMSCSVHAFQCRTDKQHDKSIASTGCSLKKDKLCFKQGWSCLATTACLHEAAVELVKRQWLLSTKSATKQSSSSVTELQHNFLHLLELEEWFLWEKNDKAVFRQPQVCFSAKANELGAERISLGQLLITKWIETKNCYPEVGRQLHCFFLAQFTLVGPLSKWRCWVL